MARTKDNQENDEEGTGVEIITSPVPITQRYSSLADRLESEEKYLIENGWEATGEYDITGKSFWHDPDGAGPKTATPGPIIRLPEKGGGFQTIQQMSVPPAAWRHPHDRAVGIQRIRDNAKGKHRSLQERHNELGRVMDETNQAIGLLFTELEKWAKKQIPDKPDNIHADLVNTRRALFQALHTCKTKLEQLRQPREEKEESKD